VADIMSILSSSYASAATQNLITPGSKFAKVDPTLFQGTWTGTDSSRQPFSFKITGVSGFRANVTFQSASGLQYLRVFINTQNSFRIADSAFILTGQGTAKVQTVLTDSTTGIQQLETAYAKRTS
jgi:hypothetical protein